MVNFQLLLHQRIALNAGGLFRRGVFSGGFFRQRQALAVHRFLQQLKLVLQTRAVSSHVVTLFLQGILQRGIAGEAFTL